MATGDQKDIFNRLKDNLVPWFGNDTPNLDALLQGTAKTDNSIYNLITDTNLQTRIKTATGDALDLISLDFFGGKLPRKPDENDISFRTRILANLVQERATRKGMITVLENLTGSEPAVIEGCFPLGVGAFDQTFYYDAGFGYGWLQPYSAIIYTKKPTPTGFLGVGSYYDISSGSGSGFGYDYFFNNAYIDLSQEIIFVSDQDIIDAIQATKPFGTYMYIYIDDVYQPNDH
jgi:hypothetical protein